MVRPVKKVVSNVFEYGRAHRHLTVNPTRGIQILVKKGKRDRWLSDLELVTTLAGLRESRVSSLHEQLGLERSQGGFEALAPHAGYFPPFLSARRA